MTETISGTKQRLASVWSRLQAYAQAKPDVVAVVAHLLLALILFAPFVIFGRVLLGSGDNWNCMYPAYLLSRTCFQQQQLGLWDSYHLCGQEFFSNRLNYNFYPVNWLMFLAPQGWLWNLMTIRTLVEIWLIGVFAYGLFRHELASAKWDFFAAVCYQLCSFTWFSVTICETTGRLWFTAILYFVWSFHRRRPILSYVWLTVSVACLWLSDNPVLAFYATLIIMVLATYRVISAWPKPFRPSVAHGVLLLGLLTGILISMVRMWPVAQAIKDSSRTAQGFLSIHDESFMAYRLFVPEVFGIGGDDPWLPLLGDVFGFSIVGANMQNTFSLYFGVLPALLVVWGFYSIRSGRGRFWKWFALATLLLALRVQPVAGLFFILTHPFLHPNYLIAMVPIGFCGLVGHAAEQFERHAPTQNVRGILSGITGLMSVVVCGVIVVFTYGHTGLIRVGGLVAIGALVCIGAGYWLACRQPWSDSGKTWLITGAGVCGLVAFIGVVCWSIATLAEGELLIKTAAGMVGVSCSVLAITLASSVFLFAAAREKPKRWPLTVIGSAAALVILGVMLLPWWRWDAENNVHYYTRGSYIIYLWLGIFRFVVVSVVCVWICSALARQRLTPAAVFPVFLFLVVADLLPFNLHFRHIARAPIPLATFDDTAALYPLPKAARFADLDGAVIELDTVNFRIHDPCAFGIMPCSAGYSPNFNAHYGIRSYGGYGVALSRRYTQFVLAFYPNIRNISALSEALPPNDRFWDLTAVRYVPDLQLSRVRVRSGCPSRLTLYRSLETFHDAGMVLRRVTDPTFDPKTTVAIEDDGRTDVQAAISLVRAGGGLVLPAAGTQAGRFVPITKEDPKSIRAHVQTPEAAILLFADCYADGWCAYVDGKQVPVMHANYAFMAIALPAGTHEVEFRLQPPTLATGIRIMACGFAVFLVTGVVLFLVSTRPCEPISNQAVSDVG